MGFIMVLPFSSVLQSNRISLLMHETLSTYTQQYHCGIASVPGSHFSQQSQSNIGAYDSVLYVSVGGFSQTKTEAERERESHKKQHGLIG